jgi:chromosome segregation ATPase
LEFPIKGGRVTIQELRLKKNSQANDGEYSLIFDAHLNSSEKIESFVLNILYSNDALKQTQLNDIQMKLNDFKRKRTQISKEIISSEADFESQEQSYRSCQNKVELLKVQLRELTKGEVSDLSTEQNVITKIEEYDRRKSALQANESLRVIRGNTSLTTPKMDGIIGRIGQLAFIEDNETALIISWYLRNFMTCIVTNTSEVAEKLMDERSDEIDLTFPLDQIKDKGLPKHWNDSLPHEDKFDFCYAIGYARSRLEFYSINNIEASHKVFGSLLKNTLIMDTIEAAKSYRKKFEKFDGCPTILTKSGYIFYENGIIESAHLENIAVAFQSPPNIELLNVLKIIDLLKELKKAIRISEDERLSLQNCNKNHQNFKNNKNKELEQIDLNISLNETDFRRLSVSGIENQSLLLSELNQNSFDNNNNTHRRSQSRPECESEPSSKRARISR